MKISDEAREAAVYCVPLSEERRDIIAERIQQAINAAYERAAVVADGGDWPIADDTAKGIIIKTCQMVSGHIATAIRHMKEL